MTFTRRFHGTMLLIGAVVGCGTPSEPTLPNVGDGTMHLFGILTPDSSEQMILVTQTDGRTLAGVEGVLSEIGTGGALTRLAGSRLANIECAGRYGFAVGSGFCLIFDAAVRPGGRYHVSVAAPGRPTASAITTVPSAFAIDTIEAAGDPPGTEAFRVRWMASLGAHRYLVNVRAEPDCTSQPGICLFAGDAWSAVTVTAQLDTVLPATVLAPGRDDALQVAIYALNRELYEYLTTGSGGPFAVLPRQNVTGGHGVIGGWVRRARSLRPVVSTR